MSASAPQGPRHKAMSRPPRRIAHADWADAPDGFKGRVTGADLDTALTILFVEIDEVGGGPPLHTHPYDEVFILREGRARYTLGDEVIDASAGDVLMAPAHMPHKFENLGPGRMVSTDIHLSAEMIQTDLED